MICRCLQIAAQVFSQCICISLRRKYQCQVKSLSYSTYKKSCLYTVKQFVLVFFFFFKFAFTWRFSEKEVVFVVETQAPVLSSH